MNMVKRTLAVVGLVAGGLIATTAVSGTAQARDSFSFGLSVPGAGFAYSNGYAPYYPYYPYDYYAPPVRYYAPYEYYGPSFYYRDYPRHYYPRHYYGRDYGRGHRY